MPFLAALLTASPGPSSSDLLPWEHHDTRVRRDGKIDRKILEPIRRKEGPAK